MLLSLTSNVNPDPAYTLAAADSVPPTTPIGLVQAASLASGKVEASGGIAPTAASAPTGTGSLSDFIAGIGTTAQAAGAAYAQVRDAINGDTAVTPVNSAGTVATSSAGAWVGILALLGLGVGAIFLVSRVARKVK